MQALLTCKSACGPKAVHISGVNCINIGNFCALAAVLHKMVMWKPQVRPVKVCSALRYWSNPLWHLHSIILVFFVIIVYHGLCFCFVQTLALDLSHLPKEDSNVFALSLFLSLSLLGFTCRVRNTEAVLSHEPRDVFNRDECLTVAKLLDEWRWCLGACV